MMRSLYSGVAGLKNHQTRMDVTGNNIANVNTNGYKAARTTFNDMFSQNVKGAASPRDNLGGTNPLQIGLGMNVASVDNIFTGGSLQATGKNTDLAIDGDGFFILQNGLERFYTRAGNFDFDALGNYVVPNTGLQVMGWLADENGVIQGAGDVGSLTYLTIPLDTPMYARASTVVNIAGNLKSDSTIYNPPTDISSLRTAPLDIYDSLGQKHLATTTFTKTGTGNAATGAAGAATGGNTWAYTIEIDGYDPAIVTGKLEFDQAGHLAEIDDVAVTTNASGAVTLARTAARTFTPTPTGLPGGNGAEPLQFSIDLTKLTQHGTQSTADAQSTDGYPSGMLDKTSVTIDGNGVMVGSFSNGRLKVLGQVGLSKFTNPAGLNKIGTSLYMQSNNSGAPQVNVAGMDGLGEISSSALEMSNVDLSEEFTTMITTQRGFQANSRIITTSDSMLEELVNLKR